MSLYLSRITVSKSPSVQALSALLNPKNVGQRTDANHRLLWSLFADGPERKRDFLWRAESEGQFLTLSARPPEQSDLFSRLEVKPFNPVLAVGDRLHFVLRANATIAKKGVGRVDVVMNALHAIAPTERSERRMGVAQEQGKAWLERQGARCGFAVINCDAADYSVHALPTYRGKRRGQPQFGILDLQGRIEVSDPDAFRMALGDGFGRAKAFGCGFMLIRRAG